MALPVNAVGVKPDFLLRCVPRPLGRVAVIPRAERLSGLNASPYPVVVIP